jgi:hypothetical protein
MRKRFKNKALAAAALAALASAAAGASLAQGEQVCGEAHLCVAFHGNISPGRLPRTGTAPVAVLMGGKVKTTDKSTPPKLEKIVLDINRHGQLETKGLATCSYAKLNSISSAGARRACGDALVGHGNVTSLITLPDQGTFASNGPLLAFNGRRHGHPAVFAQVNTKGLLPLTYVIPFEVRKGKGEFGTSLVGVLPPIASEYGYISSFDMALQRRYHYRGQRLSYASAGCPAPKGFSEATFNFAKASYIFADGQQLSSSLSRQCKVRG